MGKDPVLVCRNCGKGYLQSEVKGMRADLTALYCSIKCQRERVMQMARIIKNG